MREMQRPHHLTSIGRGKIYSPLQISKTSAFARSLAALTGHAEVSIPTRLEEILRLLKMGAAILPVVTGGKAPATSGGVKAATKDKETLTAIFKARPNLNYGIATGAASGFFALDIDGPTGRKTIAELAEKHGALPKTVRSLTPHGEHRLFKSPGYPIPNSVGRIGPGVDVRGDLGYVVGPGSRTSEGLYRYAGGRGPDDIGFANSPQWLLDLIGRKTLPIEEISPSKPAAEQLVRAKAYADAAFKSECERLRKAPPHQRNNTLNICSFKSGRLAARGLIDPRKITAELTQIAKAIGLNDGEIGPTIASGLKAGIKNPARLPFEKGVKPDGADRPTSPSRDELTEQLAKFSEDDIANAERFARRHGRKVIFSVTRGFLVFDGKRYRPDDRLMRVELAKDTAKKIEAEVPLMPTEETRKHRSAFAKQSRSLAAINRMLELAKSLLVVDDKFLDANPWLLNTETFTIDLRTGRYNRHDARDLITKIAPVKAKPGSKCALFDAFLTRITEGDRELAAYIQKAVGYTLTGATTEQVLFFVHGKSGKNGKSTLVNPIRDMLGDYGAHTPTDTLLTKVYDNAIPADLARLEGKRMVTAIESNVNRQLDEAKLKAMTGGEPITARHLYKNFSEFVPQFKLWLVANDRPHVRATADAIWRRIRVIPLNANIPATEVDPDLSDKLKAEWPGILSWAVRGALKWQQEGLAVPESVKAASAEWREAVDHVRRFVTEALITGCDPAQQLPAGEIHSRYKTWCAHNGEEPLSPGKLKGRLMEAFDLTHAHTKRGSIWKGVRWKD